MANWIVLLAAILPFWFLQNVIHELSHALTLYFGWHWGFKIWPFPSKRLGRFTFADVVYEPTPKSKPPGYFGWALVSIMPHLVNELFVILSGVASYIFILKNNILGSLLCCLFGVYNQIDFSFGMSSIFRETNQSDIWRFQNYTNTSISKLRWLTVLLIVSGWVCVLASSLFAFGV